MIWWMLSALEIILSVSMPDFPIFTEYNYVPSVEEYVSPHELWPVEMRVTCYLPTGNRTASGVYPFVGCCASNREHLGDVAAVYTLDMEFIGYFECVDTGGAQTLKNGTSLDIYCENMTQARDWINTYGDYCLVHFIKADG